jgi:hypothetical protein
MRECATRLREPHEGGDHQLHCLVQACKAALEVTAEIFGRENEAMPRGYKDACDRLVEDETIDEDLSERLKRVFDAAERAAVWSALEPGQLANALDEGPDALRELANALEPRLTGADRTTQQWLV